MKLKTQILMALLALSSTSLYAQNAVKQICSIIDRGDDAVAVGKILKNNPSTDIDATGHCGYETLLMRAADKGRTNILKTLIKAGAEVSFAMADDGRTALTYAVNKGNAKITEILIKAGAEVNIEEDDLEILGITTPLMDAAASGNNEIVKLLLDAGAKINVLDFYSGATAYDYAVAEDKTKTAKYLQSRGAKSAKDIIGIKGFIQRLEKNCNQHMGDVCYLLAGLYRKGTYVKQDLSKAKKLYARACELETKKACNK